MTLLHVDAGPFLRGGQQSLWNLASGLDGLGLAQVFLVHEESPLVIMLKPFGEVHTWRARRPWSTTSMAALLRTVSRESASLIHLHDSLSHTLGWITGPLHRLPLAVTRRLSLPPKNLLKYRAATTIGISSHVVNVLVDRGLDPEKVTLIHPGINTGDAEGPAPWPDHLPPLRETYRFVFAGALEEMKDPFTLLKAVRELCKTTRDFQLVILGEGPLAGPLRRYCTDCAITDVVSMAGAVPDASGLLGHFDSLILPSVEEGLGRVVLEAMKAGLAVIVSDCPSFKDMVTHDSTGLTFPMRNERALAGEMECLLGNPSHGKDLAHRAFNDVLPLFSLEISARSHAELYARILGGESTS